MSLYLRCELCNRYLVMGQDGWFSCPSGHGGRMLDTHDVEPEPVLPSLFVTGEEEGATMIRRYFWAWYWAQSNEPASADLKGWPTREEAIENAKPAELALIRLWGPGKGFRLEIQEVAHAG